MPDTQIFYFIPSLPNGDMGEMVHCCTDCLLTREGQTEGTVPNYGDESCEYCDFTTADDEDNQEEDDEGEE